MRRLLQLGTYLLLLAAFLAPLAECFDSWDAPGLSDDTEFALLSLLFLLALVLLVSKIVSTFAQLVTQVATPHIARLAQAAASQAHSIGSLFIPPLSSPPLRI